MSTGAHIGRFRPAERTRPWSRADWLAIWLVTVSAAGLRFAHVASPSRLVFDEWYYVREACLLAIRLQSACGVVPYSYVMHPPLAKRLIGLGIETFGYTPLGWRIGSVIAGVVTVALLYLLARKLLNSTRAATLASGLLAIDFLHVIHSRLAMLDVFVTLFSVGALTCCVLDRDDIARKCERRPGAGKRLFSHPWRFAAGVASGAAVAAKWSGAFTLATVMLLTIGWEISTRRAAGVGNPVRRTLREEGLSIAGWLIALPLVVYVATYVGVLPASLLAWPWEKNSWAGAFVRQQVYMLGAHSSLMKPHPYQSPPWMWFSSTPPATYFFQWLGDWERAAIVAMGNPLVWWFSVPALTYVASSLVRRRHLFAAEAFILVAFALSYAPWYALARMRTVFVFHFLPTVPILCLALACTAARIGTTRAAKTVAAVWAAAVLASFAFAYPLLTAVPVQRASWRGTVLARYLFQPLSCEALQRVVLPLGPSHRNC